MLRPRRRLVYIKSETVQSSFEENRHVLEDLGIDVTTLPALSFRFKNLDTLRVCLERPADYLGLLVTSGRTVEAITSSGITQDSLNEWKSLRNYCVGQTTLRRLETDLGSGWSVRGGAETGNAELLSELIIKDLKDTPTNRPFLFPCSNLALGTLVTRLTDASHPVEPLEVYETVKHPDLEAAVQRMDLNSIDFVLFFSPSTVQFFLDAIRKSGLTTTSTLKLLAIGPSTAQEILLHGLPVFATCSKPDIQSLAEIITATSA